MSTTNERLLQVRPLRWRHCWSITKELNVPAVRGVLGFSHFKLAGRFKSYGALGPSAALFCGPTLVAIGGIIVQQPGVGEAWSVHSAALGRLGLGYRFVRLARRQLALWIAATKLHRLQATCSLWSDPAVRGRFTEFLTVLGFTPEAQIRAADSLGQDVLIYAMFPGEVA